MKKLMFLAVVTSATVASAITCVTTKGYTDECGEYVCGDTYAGIAHKVTITLKTTAFKNLKAKSSRSSCEAYRAQTSMKISGLIWQKLDSCDGCVPFGDKIALWTKTTAINPEDFSVMLGKIGKSSKSKSIEGFGKLTADGVIDLSWAGFGTTAGKAGKAEGPCGEDGAECSEWVKSISGGVAGNVWVGLTEKCGETCDPIAYDCCLQAIDPDEASAAYGTIKISYDKSVAKKVALADDDSDVNDFVKLPASVAAEVEAGTVTIEE